MKSSKDVVDKANALLNTAAAAQIPAALDEPSQGEASRDSLLCRRANLSRLCGPGLASAPVTHLTSSAHPGRVVCASTCWLGLSTERRRGEAALSKRGTNTCKAQVQLR